MTVDTSTGLVHELERLDLFAHCDRASVEAVAGCVEGTLHIRQGGFVCRQGDQPGNWWVVVDGTADVSVDGRFVGAVGPGEAVGELALVDGSTISASVVATTDMTVHVVSGESFAKTLSDHPSLALGLLRRTAERLRQVNHRAVRRAAREASESDGQERPPRKPTWNPFEPGYFENPYATFAALREWSGATPNSFTKGWTVGRYDDVTDVLRAKTTSVDLYNATPTPAIQAVIENQERGPARGQRSMIDQDGADHMRLRRLVSKAFTPRAIRDWEERATTLVDELLDEADERGEFDVMADYAAVLPCSIISYMLGMPVGDIAQLRAWTNAVVRGADPLATPEEQQASTEAAVTLRDYLREIVDAKHDALADDILSTLIRAEEDGDRLTHAELVEQVFLLYLAGQETTVYLIGNAIQALFEAPDQLRLLQTDPSLDTNAVEEFLRFAGPVVVRRRIPTTDVVIDGVEIPAGADLELLLSAANRDPRKFGPTADTLDLARPDASEHLAFATGAHYCLGASLARLEARVAIPTLVRRFPDLSPTNDTPAWRNVVLFRGLDELPVTVR